VRDGAAEAVSEEVVCSGGRRGLEEAGRSSFGMGGLVLRLGWAGLYCVWDGRACIASGMGGLVLRLGTPALRDAGVPVRGSLRGGTERSGSLRGERGGVVRCVGGRGWGGWRRGGKGRDGLPGGVTARENAVPVRRPLLRGAHAIAVTGIDVVAHPDLVAIIDDWCTGQRHQQRVHQFDLAAIIVHQRRKAAADAKVDARTRVVGISGP